MWCGGGLSEAGGSIRIERLLGVGSRIHTDRYGYAEVSGAVTEMLPVPPSWAALPLLSAKATGFYLSVPSQASTELCTTRLTNAARALARAGSSSASAA